MSRTVRLLNLLQILRSYRHPVSGERLAERLGVSLRTLYRDIATIQAMGADIKGEAGVGYILKPTFFLHPLMFTPNEINSLLLGIQWVSQYADAPLSQGASQALSKILDVLPTHIKNDLNTFALRVGPPISEILAKEDLSTLRDAIADQKKIEISYQSEDGTKTQRVVWPFTIGYFIDGRILVAWCEKRQDFRHFKTHRILSINVLAETYPRSRTNLFREWQANQLQKNARKRE